jgi:hypothetical protein
MLTAPRADFLATAEEAQLLGRIESLEQRLKGADGQDLPALRERLGRLRGTLIWVLETEYHARLTVFDRNLRELHDAVAILRDQYRQFVRVRQAAAHSYVGYERPINRLRTRVSEAISRIDLLMAKQGRVIEVVAVDELRVRREKLETYQNQARYALADSYDRATQMQARGTGSE